MSEQMELEQPVSTQSTELVREGSPEYEGRRTAALKAVAQKYAYSAQQGGMVLRRRPLKLQPYNDMIFNRISKAEYGFRYRDAGGRKRFWFPRVDDLLSEAIDDGIDNGLVIVERIEFMPGRPEIAHDEDGCRVLNLWRPPVWRADHSLPSPTPFLEHLKYLLDGDETAIDHLLNFFAHMIQKPAERIGHAILLTSEAKGIGKSTLGAILRRLVGEQNSRVAQTKDLKSQFDGWLLGRLLIQVDEVYEAGNWDLANKLKPLITEPTVSVNVKYGPQIEVDNYARFLMFSNHSAPLSIEAGDRRYFIFDSKAQPRSDDYYEDLNRYIGTEAGMNAVYTHLTMRDISGFNPFKRPPMTEAKADVIEVSGNPLRVYVVEAVESGHLRQELGSEFSLDAFQRQLKDDGFGQHAKNLKELTAAMDAAGIASFRRVGADGRKRRLWKLPDHPDDKHASDSNDDF